MDARADAGPTSSVATGGQGFRAFRTSETYARVAVDPFGISFGDGAGAFDTNLYRSAASVLKTDDAVVITGSATIGLAKIEDSSSLFTLRQSANSISTGYALQQDATSTTYLNAVTTLRLRVANNNVISVTATDVTFDQGIIMVNAKDIALGTGTGTKIGTATGQKLGFWNATPVVQQVLATGAGATVDNVISLLQTLGLCKQS